MSNEYEDIINLPHHVSKRRPQMSMMGRAAQFAPFSALAGLSAALNEVEQLSNKESDDNRPTVIS